MVAPDVVSEEEDFSDESSFYGDEDTKERFEIVVQTIASSHIHNRDMPGLTSIALKNVKEEAQKGNQVSKQWNRHEGNQSAWQLSETAESFLERIPPQSTSQADYGPWIWCANPFEPNPECAPRIEEFVAEGRAILAQFGEVKTSTEKSMAGKAAASITKKLAPIRKEAEDAIARAAKQNYLTTGKWMLFPMPEDVDDWWKAVVEETIKGDLGVDAKVATDTGKGDRVPRLICCYTKDFSDYEDVKRVLKALQVKGLAKNIYYKTDAYTYLDISSGNPYGLRASMYSSQDMLKKATRS